MNFASKISAALAVVSLSMGSAFAALPADATTAIADMKSDGALLAGAFLVVCIVIGAIKVLKKGAN